MTTSKKTSAYFIINFFDKTISGTKTSFNKASKGISPFYEELTMKMNAHPTFELAVKEPKHKSNKAKRTYDGMDFDFMEDYISIQANAAQIMSEYLAVRAFAKEQKISVYPFTKKWFLGEFDPDGEGFDMAKAEKEISDAKIAEAVMNAATATADENDDAA